MDARNQYNKSKVARGYDRGKSRLLNEHRYERRNEEWNDMVATFTSELLEINTNVFLMNRELA